MKNILRFSVILLAGITACTLVWSGPKKGADTQWERDSLYYDFSGIVLPCVDEPFRVYGEIPYMRHTVTTPSGNTSYKFQMLPVTPKGPPYHLVFQVSGKVYLYQNGHPVNESFHLGPNEVTSMNSREVYRADDGDRLIFPVQIHFTTNANGELTVEKYFLYCE